MNYSDLNSSLPNNDTPYPVASITKLFTVRNKRVFLYQLVLVASQIFYDEIYAYRFYHLFHEKAEVLLQILYSVGKL